MVFGTLGVLNASSTCDIFYLPWVYWDVTPLEVEEDLVYDLLTCKSLLWRKISFTQTQGNQAMPVGQPKMGGSWWRGLTECSPLEKGMASQFSILALRTP